MPSQRSSPSTAGPDDDRSSDRGSRWSWLLPAGTFLAGCVLGGVLVGVGATGDDDPAPTASGAVAEGDVAPEEGADGAAVADSGLYVRVPESCLETADDATTLVEQVDRVVAAVADLDPERLRQTVDDVQQIRNGVQSVAEQCRAAAAERLEGAEPDEAAPATPAS